MLEVGSAAPSGLSNDEPAGANATARDGLAARVTSSAGWTLGSSAFNQMTRLVAGVVMARLLSPHDYGLAGMALVFSSLVLVLSDLSLGAALVQRPEITEEDRSTVFWTSAGVGVLLTGGGVALSGSLATFYGEPQVRPLFMAISLTFFLSSLMTTPAALLQREMHFRAIAMRVTTATMISSVVGIGFAAAGVGAWALIAQQITLSVASTSFLWLTVRWRPRVVFSRASLADLGSFGINVFGGRVMGYVSGNVDNIIIGRSLGSPALGAYALAYNLMLLPLARLSRPIQDVLFPALTELQNQRARLAAAWLRANRVVAAAVAAPMVGLVVIAPDLVEVVLGAKWRPAVRVIQVLAVVGIAQAVADPGNVLMALDRTRRILAFAILEAACIVVAVLIGLRWGIVGVATGVALVEIPLRLAYLRLAAVAAGIGLTDVLRNLAGVAEAGAVMLASCWLLREGLTNAGLPAGARLTLTIVVGGATYLTMIYFRAPQIHADLRTVVARRARAADR